LACEYAKCKNRASHFTIVISSLSRILVKPERAEGEFEMTDDPSKMSAPSAVPSSISGAARKPLTPAARRALAEAEARRKAAEASATPIAKEFQGPNGPEPTRYGDWERKGIASDF
jgi:hypothetical protein